MAPGGSYKRKFFSSEYSTDRRTGPVQNQQFSRPNHASQRGRGWARASLDAHPLQLTTGDRYDDTRQSGTGSKYFGLSSHNNVTTQKGFVDLTHGRNERVNDSSRKPFNQRLPSTRQPERRESGDKAPSFQFRDARPAERFGYESRTEKVRSSDEREHWVDARQASSLKHQEETDKRYPRNYSHHSETVRSRDGTDSKTHVKRHTSPIGNLSRTANKPEARLRKTSTSQSVLSQTDRGRDLIVKADSNNARETPVTSSFKIRKDFADDLRPEEILVTRKYQYSSTHKESSSNAYPEEERRVKIVRETPGDNAGKGCGNSVDKSWSKRREKDSGQSRNVSESISGSDVKRPFVDVHGDTDDRMLTTTVRSQVKVRQLRSKSHDFGDKDERTDRTKILDNENMHYDSSDDMSSTKKQRSESRDEERPRERFDRKVNTRDPDDLRNSLARRKKMMKVASDESMPAVANGPSSEGRHLVKRRSVDASSSKSKDHRESSPKRRRLSEGYHSKQPLTTFKRPLALPRRDFGFHSTSTIRARRYPTLAPPSRRGIARNVVGHRGRPFSSRAFGIRR